MTKSCKLTIVALFAAAVTMSAGAAQSPHRFTATLNYSGAAAENVPTLLRISPEKISGFSYSDTANGKDFEIRDENGTLLNSTLVSAEVVKTLVGSFSLVLVAPVTALVGSRIFGWRGNEKNA